MPTQHRPSVEEETKTLNVPRIRAIERELMEETIPADLLREEKIQKKREGWLNSFRTRTCLQ